MFAHRYLTTQDTLTHQDQLSDWSFSSWLTGPWKAILLRIGIIILAILILLFAISTCIIPCIRTCITRLVDFRVSAALVRYDPLPHKDTPGGVDSSTDSEGSEAEDSV